MSFRKAVAEIRASFGEVGQPVKQPLSQQDCLLILQRAQTARDALYHKALQKFGATSFRGSARGSCGGFRDGTGQAPARGNALILARLRLYYVAYACVLRSECGSAQRGKFLVVGRRSPLLRAKILLPQNWRMLFSCYRHSLSRPRVYLTRCLHHQK